MKPEPFTPTASVRLWPIMWLALLLLCQLAAAAWWAAEDQFPVGYEVCDHLLNTRRLAEELTLIMGEESERTGSLLQWLERNRRLGGRSTLIHLLMAPVMARTSGDAVPLVSLLVGSLSLTLLALSSYLLAARLDDCWTGLAAGALVLLTPPVWGYSRLYGADLPLTALVTLYAYLILRHDPWERSWRSVVFGLYAGVACLFKAAFLLWAAALLLPSVWLARRSGRSWRELLRGLGWAVLGGLIGSTFFWAGSLGELWDYTRVHVALDNPASELHENWTILWATFYLTGIFKALGPAIGLAVGAGLAVCLMRRRPGLGLCWGWVLTSYVIFTLIGTKWSRFMLPALPALCVMGAIGLRRLGRWGSGLLGVCVGSALVIFALGTFGIPRPWTGLDVDLCHAPMKANWREISGRLQGELGHRDLRVISIEGPSDWGPDNYSRLELYLLERFPLAMIHRRSGKRDPAELARFEAARDQLEMRLIIGGEADLDPTIWWMSRRLELDPPPRPPLGRLPGRSLDLRVYLRR